jgi:outer membrane autotransporter protein
MSALGKFFTSTYFLILIFSGSALAGDLGETNNTAVQGVLPLGQLRNLGLAGSAALTANLQNTSSIQNAGAVNGVTLPFLLPFYQQSGWGTQSSLTSGPAAGSQAQSQQQQALWDATRTVENARIYSDGLGSQLGGAYQSLAQYVNTGTGAGSGHTVNWIGITNSYSALDTLINYTYGIAASNNTAAKKCLGHGDASLGVNCSDILANNSAISNAYGEAYLNGITQVNPAQEKGNPRPTVTRPYQTDASINQVTYFNAIDYWGNRVNSQQWLGRVPCPAGGPNSLCAPQTPTGGNVTGTIRDLYTSQSYPSGHSTDAFTESLLLGILLPNRFQQMATRGAEAAVDRVVLGAHYAMDTIGARTLTYYDVAQLMANNPTYLNISGISSHTSNYTGNTNGVGTTLSPVTNYQDLVSSAQGVITTTLQAQCGDTIANCASKDTSRFSNLANDKAFYESTLTLGLPVVYGGNTSAVNYRTFSEETKNAGYLLLTRLPYLTAEQRADVISTTQYMPAAGGFLDNGSSFGYYSRINLFAAGGGYGAFNDMTGDVSITMDASKGGFNASDTWSNDIGGNKGFTLNGDGIMRFTGMNTYLGHTIVNGGALIVDGSISSDVSVYSGGLLGGHGSFGGGVIYSGGVISPGNSPGTITSNGNLTLHQGSTYLAEVDGQKADKIVVNGAATVNNASLVLNTSQPAYLPGRQFNILTATGGVTGSFGSFTPAQSFSFLNPYLSYGSNSASVGYALTPFSTVGRTINQRNVGNALTIVAFGPISGPGANILNTLFYGSYQSAQAVMDTVGGAGLAGVQTTAMEVGQMASSTVSDQIAFWRSGESNDMTGVTLHEGNSQDRARSFMAYAPTEDGVTTKKPIVVKGPVAGLVAPVPPARTFRAWGSMFGGGANFLSDAGRGTPSATAGYYGGLLGVDYQLTPNVLVGVSLGGSSSGFSVGSLSTTGKLTGFHAGLYGAYTMGASYLALNETFSAYSNQTNRSAGGYSFLPYESLTANFGSTEFRTRLEGGHSLLMGGLKATSFVAAEIAAYNANGFSERSSLLYQSSLALKNNGQAINSLPTFVGLRLSNAYTLENGWRLAPIGSLAYVHEFFPQRQFTNILMSMPGQDFNVAGPRSTYNLVQTKLGAQLFLNKAFALYSDFQGEFSSMSQSYGGTAGLKYYW